MKRNGTVPRSKSQMRDFVVEDPDANLVTFGQPVKNT